MGRLSFRAAFPLFAAIVIGLAGTCLPGAYADSPTYLAWLALVVFPVGAWLGARRFDGLSVSWLLVVPAVWAIALIWSVPDVMRTLPRPLGGLCVLYGLYLAGLGLGRAAGPLRPLWAWGAACALVISALPFALGLGAEEALPQVAPGFARVALECSPVGWTLECSGWDWSHTDRDLYARSGIEFAPRHPHRLQRTGLLSLGLGAVLALALLRRKPSSLRTS